MQKNNLSKPYFSYLWDLFCIGSIVGIWPRYIEPRILSTTSLSLKIPNLPSALRGFKILQISDLHINAQMPKTFLEKLIKSIDSQKPDLIAFTGDFLCYSLMTQPLELSAFLHRLQAPYGCFAVLGNHDYAKCVSINDQGDYDVIDSQKSSLARAFNRLGKTVTLTKSITQRAKDTPLHTELLELLAKTPCQLLHNETRSITIKDTKLNICGLGEYMLGRADCQEAFKKYDPQYPGIVLLHNPDGAPSLKEYPGDVVLCGHTHGGQVNLPWMWKKFTLLENMNLKKGLVRVGDKWVYVSRGVGSVLSFRWFSPPEILVLTLE